MRIYLARRCGRSITFISVLELQKSGYAHLHILVDRYLDQGWVSDAWNRVGGGKIVDIRWVDVHRIAGYLSKYLTKEMILDIPEGTRRYSTSRNIRLFDRIAPGNWKLLRAAIDLFILRYSDRLLTTAETPEGELRGFAVKSGN